MCSPTVTLRIGKMCVGVRPAGNTCLIRPHLEMPCGHGHAAGAVGGKVPEAFAMELDSLAQ